MVIVVTTMLFDSYEDPDILITVYDTLSSRALPDIGGLLDARCAEEVCGTNTVSLRHYAY